MQVPTIVCADARELTFSATHRHELWKPCKSLQSSYWPLLPFGWTWSCCLALASTWMAGISFPSGSQFRLRVLFCVPVVGARMSLSGCRSRSSFRSRLKWPIFWVSQFRCLRSLSRLGSSQCVTFTHWPCSPHDAFFSSRICSPPALGFLENVFVTPLSQLPWSRPLRLAYGLCFEEEYGTVFPCAMMMVVPMVMLMVMTMVCLMVCMRIIICYVIHVIVVHLIHVIVIYPGSMYVGFDL